MTAMSFNFAQRSTALELMDDEGVGYQEFRDCLVDLAKVNRLTRACPPTLSFFDRLLSHARELG